MIPYKIWSPVFPGFTHSYEYIFEPYKKDYKPALQCVFATVQSDTWMTLQPLLSSIVSVSLYLNLAYSNFIKYSSLPCIKNCLDGSFFPYSHLSSYNCSCHWEFVIYMHSNWSRDNALCIGCFIVRVSVDVSWYNRINSGYAEDWGSDKNIE